MLTCVHTAAGLCPACQADYEADPIAWIEYGDHPDGIRRSRDLAEELAARPVVVAPPVDDSDIPL